MVFLVFQQQSLTPTSSWLDEVTHMLLSVSWTVQKVDVHLNTWCNLPQQPCNKLPTCIQCEVLSPKGSEWNSDAIILDNTTDLHRSLHTTHKSRVYCISTVFDYSLSSLLCNSDEWKKNVTIVTLPRLQDSCHDHAVISKDPLMFDTKPCYLFVNGSSSALLSPPQSVISFFTAARFHLNAQKSLPQI